LDYFSDLVNVFQEKRAGYAFLLERRSIDLPLRHESWISDVSARQSKSLGPTCSVERFPAVFDPGADDFDHLVFALKYDGVDLTALKAVFLSVDREVLARRIVDRPHSKYGRRIFFFYEMLTERRLEIDDFTGAYCPALAPRDYFVAVGARRKRYRVIDNLLGTRAFCPLVRRTERLKRAAEKELGLRAAAIVEATEPLMMMRAIRYLYTKESKSSFAIEHEEPGSRIERYVRQLESIASYELDTETGLTQLQNSIVDQRYVEAGFRREGDDEVYIGETLGFHEKIHHIGLRSRSTPAIMAGWAKMRSVDGVGGEVVEAACRGFSFVFIHPYGDGNGRIHRLLIHWTLARRKFGPERLIVPISAVLLKDQAGYDAVLEDFSSGIMSSIEYRLGSDGRVSVDNDVDDLYRYPDLTVQCEATFSWLERAIEEELVRQLDFLRRFDAVRAQMRAVVEMPDRKEQLFIKICLNNGGKMSKNKRGLFSELDDATIAQLEVIISAEMGESAGGGWRALSID